MDAEFKDFQSFVPGLIERMREDGSWIRNRTENPSWITQVTVPWRVRDDAAGAGYQLQRALGKVIGGLEEWVQHYPHCGMDTELQTVTSAVSATESAVSTITGLTFNDGWKGEGADAYGTVARNNVTQFLAAHSAGIKCRDAISGLVTFCELKLAKVTRTANEAVELTGPVISHLASSWHPGDWIDVCNSAAETIGPMGEVIKTALADIRERFSTTGEHLSTYEEELWDARKEILTPTPGVWDR